MNLFIHLFKYKFGINVSKAYSSFFERDVYLENVIHFHLLPFVIITIKLLSYLFIFEILQVIGQVDCKFIACTLKDFNENCRGVFVYMTILSYFFKNQGGISCK